MSINVNFTYPFNTSERVGYNVTENHIFFNQFSIRILRTLQKYLLLPPLSMVKCQVESDLFCGHSHCHHPNTFTFFLGGYNLLSCPFLFPISPLQFKLHKLSSVFQMLQALNIYLPVGKGEEGRRRKEVNIPHHPLSVAFLLISQTNLAPTLSHMTSNASGILSVSPNFTLERISVINRRVNADT